MPDSTDPSSVAPPRPAGGSKIWIIGLVIFLIGTGFVLVGVLAVGKAAVDATQKRLVHTARLVPGERLTIPSLRVDAELAARVEITAEVVIPPEQLESPGAATGHVSFSIPASLEVTDSSGTVIEMHASPLTGSVHIPAEDSPHRDSFDPRVECSFKTRKFDAPPAGEIGVVVEVDAVTDSGESVTGASLMLHDQIPRKTAAWGVSGALFLVGGPVMSFAGYFVFGIGVLITRSRLARARNGTGVEGLQLVALIWGLLAGFGMLFGLIPLLGWTNWLSIPVSSMGLIFGIVAACAGRDPNKADALIGTGCCVIAVGVSIVRLVIGFGVV